MARRPSPAITPFFYVTFAAIVLEAVFNREFLSAVFPLGMAGVSLDQVGPALRAFYIIGGYAFGILTLFVPITLLASALSGSLRGGLAKLYALFVAAAVLTSILMDLQHLAAGIDNPVNSSPTETIVLVASTILALAVAAAMAARQPTLLAAPIILMVVTEVLGLLYLLGNVVTANFNVGWGSSIGGAASFAEPYFGTAAGLLFTVLGAPRILSDRPHIKYSYLATLLVGGLIEYLVMTNFLRGSSIVLGTIIIYDFGFLGVNNTNVVFLVFSAISSFVTGWYLFGCGLDSRDDRFYFGFAALVFVMTGLVFVSETVTTYILLPLVASSIVALYARLREGAEGVEAKVGDTSKIRL